MSTHNEHHGKPSLGSRLRSAPASEVPILLAEGFAYKYASGKTRRRWTRIVAGKK